LLSFLLPPITPFYYFFLSICSFGSFFIFSIFSILYSLSSFIIYIIFSVYALNYLENSSLMHSNYYFKFMMQLWLSLSFPFTNSLQFTHNYFIFSQCIKCWFKSFNKNSASIKQSSGHETIMRGHLLIKWIIKSLNLKDPS
jgi:hypothetical protein